jgi:serine/threonine protein kinase
MKNPDEKESNFGVFATDLPSTCSPLTSEMKLISEELRLQIAPRKLMRQFSLNIPSATSQSVALPGNVSQHKALSPQQAVHVWGKNQVKCRSMSVNDEPQEYGYLNHPTPHNSSSCSTGSSFSACNSLPNGTLLTSIPSDSASPLLLDTNDTFEARLGHGFLGIEFVKDSTNTQVVVKSIQLNSWPKGLVQTPPGCHLSKSLIVQAINGQDVIEEKLSPSQIMEILQNTPRPMIICFRKPQYSMVICKLCECKVDTWNLDEHTNYCVKSKRYELEADQINNALAKVSASIKANLQSDAYRPYFDQEDIHFYNALRVIAIQGSTCDVSSVESFTLCSRLLKMLDRIRQHEPTNSSKIVSERGLKYCTHIKNLLYAKMSKMRATQKFLLQQNPSTILNSSTGLGIIGNGCCSIGGAPFHRTKSLEEMEKTSVSSSSVTPLCNTRNNLVVTTSNLSTLPQRRSSGFRVSIHDFDILKPISKGAFGKVYLAIKKTTGDQYAIKVLAKEHVLRKKQLAHIETERDILVHVESPFVVKLFWTFQTKRNLFLVMEYLPGGDFMSLLECIVQLEEQVAKVYIAEIALALNHLHSKGCVHRDLKPDNILISSTGHIKLTDFGLSEEGVSMSDSDSEDQDQDQDQDQKQKQKQKQTQTSSSSFEMNTNVKDLVNDVSSLQIETNRLIDSIDQTEIPSSLHTSTLIIENKTPRASSTGATGGRSVFSFAHTNARCGTPDYLSPEIILGKPHGPPVDYWALGVILYEMLVGFPPFNDDTVEAIFNNIIEHQILWPDGEKSLSKEAMDLINQLLEPDPEKRIGWNQLVAHSFFDGINWDTLLETTPPFVPTLEGPYDTSYFNNRNLTDIFIEDEEFDLKPKASPYSPQLPPPPPPQSQNGTFEINNNIGNTHIAARTSSCTLADSTISTTTIPTSTTTTTTTTTTITTTSSSSSSERNSTETTKNSSKNSKKKTPHHTGSSDDKNVADDKVEEEEEEEETNPVLITSEEVLEQHIFMSPPIIHCVEKVRSKNQLNSNDSTEPDVSVSIATEEMEEADLYHRFPSGMYDGITGEENTSNLPEAFRSFSFTNMSALAAASRTEAELLAASGMVDSSKQKPGEEDFESALTIII